MYLGYLWHRSECVHQPQRQLYNLHNVHVSIPYIIDSAYTNCSTLLFVIWVHYKPQTLCIFGYFLVILLFSLYASISLAVGAATLAASCSNKQARRTTMSTLSQLYMGVHVNPNDTLRVCVQAHSCSLYTTQKPVLGNPLHPWSTFTSFTFLSNF